MHRKQPKMAAAAQTPAQMMLQMPPIGLKRVKRRGGNISCSIVSSWEEQSYYGPVDEEQ